MAQNEKIRIRLKSYDHKLLDFSAAKIVETAKKAGFKVIGVYDVSNEEHISNMKEMCDYYCTRMDESIELLKIEN